jgi:membrane protein
MRVKTIFSLLKETFQEWNNDNASVLAASLAYYTIFSIAPVLIIAIAIAGAIFGEDAARGEIVAQIQGLVGKDGAEVIETAIQNSRQAEARGIASLISIGLLLFGASGVFVQLQDALNQIWNVKPKPEKGAMNFIRKRLLSFSAVLGIGFLLLVSLVISALLAAFSHYLGGFVQDVSVIGQILNFAISFGFIALLFAFMFKYLPDVRITWADVRVGAIITALLFTIGKYALGLYLGTGSLGSTYGAAGSLVVVLIWVYYSAQILFFGAEFTQVYARRYGSMIRPNRYGTLVSK